MPKKRAQYHHGDLASALLRATATLIERHGVSGFSLREAAREVGVDPSACYRHFANRDALLDAFAASGFADLGARVVGAVQSNAKKPPPVQLEAMGAAYLTFALENPTHFQAMFAGRGVEVRAPLAGQPSAFAALEAVVTQWGLKVSGVSAAQQALVLWSGVHGLASLIVERALQLEPADAHKLVVQSVRVSVAGLLSLSKPRQG